MFNSVGIGVWVCTYSVDICVIGRAKGDSSQRRAAGAGAGRAGTGADQSMMARSIKKTSVVIDDNW